MDQATYLALRRLWSDVVVPYLDDELDGIKELLLKAESVEEIRRLQGRGLGIRAVLNLPEQLKMEAESKLETDAADLSKSLLHI